MPEICGYIFGSGERKEKRHLETLHRLSIADKDIFIDRETRPGERSLIN